MSIIVISCVHFCHKSASKAWGERKGRRNENCIASDSFYITLLYRVRQKTLDDLNL
jgi:hypothetical protein